MLIAELRILIRKCALPSLMFPAVAAAVGVLTSPSHAAEYVLHISVDGLNASMMQSVIDAGDAPNFKRLQDEGAWTTNARTDFSHTNTLPNHTSMITGRPVTQVPGLPNTAHHGYTNNIDPPASETLHIAGNPNLSYVASTFDVVHDAGLSTAFYAAKYKFVIFDQSYNDAHGAPHPNDADKIDRFFQFNHDDPPYSQTSHEMFLDEMAANHYRYTFVHWADTDDAGHSYGWGSAQWKSSLEDVDGYLGDVLDLVESDETLAGKTSIVLSTDHGGSGFGHSTPSLETSYRIPFFAWGAGVAHGNLYAFNSGVRADPGTARVGYEVGVQPIRNGDGGNLALDLLGLGPIPGSLINVGQNLRVALPGDFNLDNKVDAMDYTVWRNKLGSPYLPSEFDLWKHFYGTSLGSGSGSAASALVPEPSWFCLVVGISVGLGAGRRRKMPRR